LANKIKSSIIKALIKRSPFLASKLIYDLAALEGGELVSKSIREYITKYKISVGMYTYGSCFKPYFNTGGSIIVGRYCSIAENVRYFGANHTLDNVSMSPYFYNPALGYNVKDVTRNTLVIGNDVWIGTGVIITASCHNIGNGAVIGAGSIITHDVLPYSVVAGNPGKLLRMRFTDDIIKMIEDTQWWNYTPDEVMMYYAYMDDPSKFYDEFMKKSKID
jgi:acetyltransferase-like isoleucine patch superfamily enzyme